MRQHLDSWERRRQQKRLQRLRRNVRVRRERMVLQFYLMPFDEEALERWVNPNGARASHSTRRRLNTSPSDTPIAQNKLRAASVLKNCLRLEPSDDDDDRDNLQLQPIEGQSVSGAKNTSQQHYCRSEHFLTLLRSFWHIAPKAPHVPGEKVLRENERPALALAREHV